MDSDQAWGRHLPPLDPPTNRSMRLQDPELFELVMQWLLHDRLVLSPFRENHPASSETWLKDCVRLYSFANRNEFLGLKNAIIHNLFTRLRIVRHVQSTIIVSEAYSENGPGSGLRRIIIAWMSWYIERECLKRPETQAWLQSEPEISKDLVVAYSQRDRTDHLGPMTNGAVHFLDRD